jgi:hypothetical protein
MRRLSFLLGIRIGYVVSATGISKAAVAIPHTCVELGYASGDVYKLCPMISYANLEDAITSQELRLTVLRRQAFRGERHVMSRLKRLERDHYICKRRRKHNTTTLDDIRLRFNTT